MARRRFVISVPQESRASNKDDQPNEGDAGKMQAAALTVGRADSMLAACYFLPPPGRFVVVIRRVGREFEAFFPDPTLSPRVGFVFYPLSAKFSEWDQVDFGILSEL
jgi:hypothetical protein